MAAIIAFISQKGGVGKSTLARALASETSQQGIKTLLADLDPQQTTSYQWSQIKKQVKSLVFNIPNQIWSLTNQYELIVIDGPAHTSSATKEIAQKADLIIQPVGSSRDDLIPAVKEFNALAKAGIDKQKLVLVLTRLSTDKEAIAIKNYLIPTGYQFTENYIFEKSSYKTVQNEGKSIVDSSYHTLREQAKKLIEELLSYI